MFSNLAKEKKNYINYCKFKMGKLYSFVTKKYTTVSVVYFLVTKFSAFSERNRAKNNLRVFALPNIAYKEFGL